MAWKYRDYVIHAINENKPINRFLVEQIAGDQLVNYKNGTQPTPDQVEPLTATGFLRTTADITDVIYTVTDPLGAPSDVDINQIAVSQ